MRKLQYPQKPSFPAPDVVTKAIPVPTDGWDAISPLADMDPKRAPILVNWVPRPGWVEVRGGYQIWSTPGSGPVETLIVKRNPSQTPTSTSGEQMWAATGGALYEVSSKGLASQVASGFQSNRWQYVNFQVPGGSHYVFICNGLDTAQVYNGTSWSPINITGFPLGETASTITNIAASKQRLWLVFNQSSVVGYLPTDAIMGPLAGTQDLGDTWNKGGYLVSVFDWTIDGGEGPQAYTAFMSSQGQVTVYQGTDPTNANAWALVGTFDISPPVGTLSQPRPTAYRAATRLGSDVALITYAGLIPISQALPYDPSADRSAALTSRIQNAMNLAVQAAGQNFGWQFITFPAQTLGLLNIPLTENSVQTQYVMNMLTGAWTQFKGWNANCFELFNQQLFFGDNSGNVCQAYVGTQDNTSPVAADMQCAFNWFDDPGRNKRITFVQPLLTTSGVITPTISVDVDFSNFAPAAPVQIVNPSGATQQFISWLSPQVNSGKALAIRMQANLSAQTIPGSANFDTAKFDNAVFDGFSIEQATLQANAFNVILELGGFI